MVDLFVTAHNMVCGSSTLPAYVLTRNDTAGWHAKTGFRSCYQARISEGLLEKVLIREF